jgi:hypothetical protein
MIGPQVREEPHAAISDRTVQEFASLCIVIFGGLFALAWYRNAGPPRPAAWIVLLLVLVASAPGLFNPGWTRPVFLLLTAMTRPIGHITGKLMLAVIYYGFMTPLALLLKLTGYRPMGHAKPAASSYWSPVSEPNDVLSYVHQYQTERTEPRFRTGVDNESADRADGHRAAFEERAEPGIPANTRPLSVE